MFCVPIFTFLPSRYAITVWYFDKHERAMFRSKRFSFVSLNFVRLHFLDINFALSPQVQGRNFHCRNVANVLTCCNYLFFFKEKQEDQAKRNAKPNLQVRKTTVMFKMISSPYCTLSRVCLRLFLFHVRRHKIIVAFHIYLHDVNSKFDVNCHYGCEELFMLHSFWYHLMKNLHSCKTQGNCWKKNLKSAQR